MGWASRLSFTGYKPKSDLSSVSGKKAGPMAQVALWSGLVAALGGCTTTPATKSTMPASTVYTNEPFDLTPNDSCVNNVSKVVGPEVIYEDAFVEVTKYPGGSAEKICALIQNMDLFSDIYGHLNIPQAKVKYIPHLLSEAYPKGQQDPDWIVDAAAMHGGGEINIPDYAIKSYQENVHGINRYTSINQITTENSLFDFAHEFIGHHITSKARQWPEFQNAFQTDWTKLSPKMKKRFIENMNGEPYDEDLLRVFASPYGEVVAELLAQITKTDNGEYGKVYRGEIAEFFPRLKEQLWLFIHDQPAFNPEYLNALTYNEATAWVKHQSGGAYPGFDIKKQSRQKGDKQIEVVTKINRHGKPYYQVTQVTSKDGMQTQKIDDLKAGTVEIRTMEDGEIVSRTLKGNFKHLDLSANKMVAQYLGEYYSVKELATGKLELKPLKIYDTKVMADGDVSLDYLEKMVEAAENMPEALFNSVERFMVGHNFAEFYGYRSPEAALDDVRVIHNDVLPIEQYDTNTQSNFWLFQHGHEKNNVDWEQYEVHAAYNFLTSSLHLLDLQEGFSKQSDFRKAMRDGYLRMPEPEKQKLRDRWGDELEDGNGNLNPDKEKFFRTVVYLMTPSFYGTDLYISSKIKIDFWRTHFPEAFDILKQDMDTYIQQAQATP
ncbi:MAG: hypothetical protein KTR14_06070 [Vampirovibrio sp.]|nr:hypothetical protein [Vampirovibrio sp.]